MKKHPNLTLLRTLIYFENVCTATMETTWKTASFLSIPARQKQDESKQGKVHNIFIKVSYLASLSVNIFVYFSYIDRVKCCCFFSTLLNTTISNSIASISIRKVTDGNIVLAFIVVDILLKSWFYLKNSYQSKKSFYTFLVRWEKSEKKMKKYGKNTEKTKKWKKRKENQKIKCF